LLRLPFLPPPLSVCGSSQTPICHASRNFTFDGILKKTVFKGGRRRPQVHRGRQYCSTSLSFGASDPSDLRLSPARIATLNGT
jgi:hypothetical protein